MAHAIRPDSYMQMRNFYTSTVYNKGAEIIRMYYIILGRCGFRRGMDLYFKRHDGQAVTCDDFRNAMADANKKDLSQFENWYKQAGTPVIEVEEKHDVQRQTYTLNLKQTCAIEENYQPQYIPIILGILDEYGRDIHTNLIIFNKLEQSFTFKIYTKKPVISLLRNFSAPVKLKFKRKRTDLAFLMANDYDIFNSWEAGQILAQELLLELIGDYQQNKQLKLDEIFINSFGKILINHDLDAAFKTLAITLPNEKLLAQQMNIIDVEAIYKVRQFMMFTLATTFKDELLKIYHNNHNQDNMGQRSLKNIVLRYLILLENNDEIIDLISQQFKNAKNMTDVKASLQCLVDVKHDAKNIALNVFYTKWQNEPLMLDTWFSLQAMSKLDDTFEQVVNLSKHKDFTLKNPNRMRALIGVFCQANQLHFHAKNGQAYKFLADKIIELNKINPQIAARIAGAFKEYKRLDENRQKLMSVQLQRILDLGNLSNDVYEVISKIKGDNKL
jgi:aminopeptidase N